MSNRYSTIFWSVKGSIALKRSRKLLAVGFPSEFRMRYC
uniref:Uncharacterized protein n=1 Tax=Arundo donax TaxID=35708 RepID=A0A0A9CLS1_ARUDO